MTTRPLTHALLACGAALAACDGELEGDLEATGETQQAITATTQTQSIASAIASEFHNLGGIQVIGSEPLTGTVFNLDITAEAKWIGTVNTEVTWDSDDVRQGADLKVERTVGPTAG